MKKAIALPARICFVIVVCIATAALSAGDIVDDGYLLLQNRRDAASPSYSGNRDKVISNDKTTNSENSINSDCYFIGGGDEFLISVIGIPSIRYTIAINQQGDMYIPELGLLKLSKITLSEAKKTIESFVREKLKKRNEIYVQLSRVKNVTVTVNGAVENPGTYVLSGGNRILDAIRLANRETIPSINEHDYRNVLCKNKDTAKTVDLFDYLLKSEMTGNPYLYPGDNISLFRATKKVLLNSMIKSCDSGWIPIKENETLAGFLSFQRFDCSVDTSTIYLQSLGESGQRSAKTIAWKDAGSVILRDKDIITIPEKKNYSPVFLVSIGGEISRPGSYPIIRNTTSAREILEEAGGPTSLADMDRAIILRNYKVDQGQQIRKSWVLEKGQETRAIWPEMVSGLEKMAITADFSILELKRFGTSIKLEENDRIIIPKTDKFVYISGNVKRPGAYEYVRGEKKDYYIKKAGGYTNKASKSNSFGMRYYEKACVQTDLSEILEGDVFIVPESQQGKALTTIVLPVLSIALSTVGTIVTIFVLLKP